MSVPARTSGGAVGAAGGIAARQRGGIAAVGCRSSGSPCAQPVNAPAGGRQLPSRDPQPCAGLRVLAAAPFALPNGPCGEQPLPLEGPRLPVGAQPLSALFPPLASGRAEAGVGYVPEAASAVQ